MLYIYLDFFVYTHKLGPTLLAIFGFVGGPIGFESYLHSSTSLPSLVLRLSLSDLRLNEPVGCGWTWAWACAGRRGAGVCAGASAGANPELCCVPRLKRNGLPAGVTTLVRGFFSSLTGVPSSNCLRKRKHKAMLIFQK